MTIFGFDATPQDAVLVAIGNLGWHRAESHDLEWRYRRYNAGPISDHVYIRFESTQVGDDERFSRITVNGKMIHTDRTWYDLARQTPTPNR